MSAFAAAVNVTAEDIRLFLSQTLEEYKEACRKGFTEHKYDCATAGLTIGNEILKKTIGDAVTSTQPGQQTTADNAEIFTMITVLAKRALPDESPWSERSTMRI